jgi:hypothetical protein
MPDLIIENMAYNTVCGPESTVVTAATTAGFVNTIVTGYRTPLEVSGTGSSSNPTCVLDTSTLIMTTGDSYFATPVVTTTFTSGDATYDIDWSITLTTAAMGVT